MQKIIIALLIAISYSSFGQKTASIPDTNKVKMMYVSFGRNLNFDEDSSYIEQAMNQIPDLIRINRQNNITLEKGLSLTDPNIASTLKNIFKVTINGSKEQTLKLAEELRELKDVQYCKLISSEPIVPPNDIPPATPNFQGMQSYLGPNPGVNMQYAWNLGISGSGVRIRDVEFGFNKNHEEFNENSGAYLAPGMTVAEQAGQMGYIEHGTSVFGVIYADYGSYGVSGLAHGANEMIAYPEWQESGYDRVYAVAQSINNSAAGDIIVYEMQDYGQNGQFVPAEFDPLIWDLTKAATDAGIVVVAAAGNGYENLDSDYYTDYRNRGTSGAIIVGCGYASLTHDRMANSTYGSRVDVQAWGENVYTSGRGDAAEINGDVNQRYTVFNSTSAATSIVGGCAAVLQSYYHMLSGNYLTGTQMRDIFVETGIPQGAGGHIGPMPNMQAAFQAVNLLIVKQNGSMGFAVFPNPAHDKINIISRGLQPGIKMKLSNSVGQIILQGAVPAENSIDISGLPSGVYFLRISDQDGLVRKIIKD